MQKNIVIGPGFVQTAMAKGEGIFWAAPVEKAVRQLYAALALDRLPAAAASRGSVRKIVELASCRVRFCSALRPERFSSVRECRVLVPYGPFR